MAKEDSSKEEEEEKSELSTTLRVATPNVGSMTGRSLEIVEMMERRNINILCVQEIKWKGAKVREIRNGYKLFYNGSDKRRNGVGVIIDPELKKNVLEVNRKSERLVWLKLKWKKSVINVVSAYVPQMGCKAKEKERFWNMMDNTTQEIPNMETVWIGGDLNGHVGDNNEGVEEIMGKYGIGDKMKRVRVL